MLVDIPQPVEDEADIVVPLSLLRSANRVLPRSFADRLQPLGERLSRAESSGTPLPEDLRAAQLRLFVLRSRPIVELRARNADRCSVIRSASSVSGPECCTAS